jgi:hypothetical protein
VLHLLLHGELRRVELAARQGQDFGTGNGTRSPVKGSTAPSLRSLRRGELAITHGMRRHPHARVRHLSRRFR